MKKNNFIFTILALCSIINFNVNAQNIAITDDDTYNANSSAMLDVKSISKGLLIPRLTSTQRNGISAPATGLLVFDTTLGGFYYYNGTSWINITSGISSNLWSFDGVNKAYLTNTNNRLGVGTNSPSAKMVVKGDATMGVDQPLFSVVNKNNDTIFAVYDGGVRVNVYDDPLVKTSGSKGGFAVGGFSPNKGLTTNEYLMVTPDSVRIYIEEGDANKASGSKGGFAVGGFSPNKTTPSDYFNIYGANAPATIVPSDARIFWYPLKEALISGRVLVESPDSVGTNSFASGFESKAIGNYSQALGYHARAFGNNSTAIGNYANAKASSTFAFGDGAVASGIGAYSFGAVGRDTISGESTGNYTIASGNYSFAFGLGVSSTKIGSFAFGTNTNATGDYSLACGDYSNASGKRAYAIGGNALASSQNAYALGYQARASNTEAFAIGTKSVASGSRSISLGYGNVSSGLGTAAFGHTCTASGWSTVAIGTGATANSIGSIAIGVNNFSSGLYTLAMGLGIKVTGQYSTGLALNDQTGTTISQNNTMAIMGGNVGVNDINPDATLHINSPSGDNPFRVQVAGSTKLLVLSNGGVSVGSNHISTPANSLYVAGDAGIGRDPAVNDLEVAGTASKATSGNWLANSDKRIKTEILDIENSYQTILKLHPVKFKYTDEWKLKNPSIKDVFYYNFIAQEFKEIFPQSVQGSGEYLNGDPVEILQIDTYNAQIVTIKAVQDLIKENQELKAKMKEIDSIKEESKLLKQRIEILENK